MLGMKAEDKKYGYPNENYFACASLAPLASADILTLFLGYGARSIEPCFANRPISWSMQKKNLRCYGFTHAFEIPNKAWRASLAAQKESIKLPIDHRWGVFIFVGGKDSKQNDTKRTVQNFKAYIVDLDWAEKLGQRLIHHREKTKLHRLGESGPFQKLFDKVGRFIKGDRTLPIELDMDQLIAEGHAVLVKGLPNKNHQHASRDCITLRKTISTGRFKDESIVLTGELEELINRTMRKATLHERHLLGYEEDGLMDCKQVAEDEKMNMDGSTSSKQSTILSSSCSEHHDLNPDAKRLFKVQEETWFHCPLPDKAVGKVDFCPNNKDSDLQLDLVAAKAEEQDMIAEYAESTEERVLWCLTEILCSVFVNIFFGILH